MAGADMDKVRKAIRPWTPRNGAPRYYINDWKALIGLEVEYYKSGNVSGVVYGERAPSNYWYKKYVQSTKVWIDDNGGIHVDYCGDDAVRDDIIAKVTERYGTGTE